MRYEGEPTFPATMKDAHYHHDNNRPHDTKLIYHPPHISKRENTPPPNKALQEHPPYTRRQENNTT